MNRRTIIRSVPVATISGSIAGCTSDSDPTNEDDPEPTAESKEETSESSTEPNLCEGADLKLVRVVEVDASTLDLVIGNLSGDTISPFGVHIQRTNGDTLRISTTDEALDFGTRVEHGHSFSIEVEVGGTIDVVSSIRVDHFGPRGDSERESLDVCMA